MCMEHCQPSAVVDVVARWTALTFCEESHVTAARATDGTPYEVGKFTSCRFPGEDLS